MRNLAPVFGAIGLCLWVGCQREGTDPIVWNDAQRQVILSLSPLGDVPRSPGNLVADDLRAAELGKRLFFDRKLSADGTVSCATCHAPDRYFTDGRPHSRGIADTSKNSPSVMAAPWFPFLFWDGRKDSVWSQALAPLEDPREHGATREKVAARVASTYRDPYEAVFGAPDDSSGAQGEDRARDRIFVNVGKALEAYERRVVVRPAPFDAYVDNLRAGGDGGGHLSRAAVRGLRTFVGEGQCVNCHSGPLFTDRSFHNLGLPTTADNPEADLGRTLGAVEVKRDPFRCGTEHSAATVCDELTYLEPRFADFQGAFKTPSLRNVGATGPYMHTGQFATLEEVVTFYKTRPGQAYIGHRELLVDAISPDIVVADLEAFLQSLTGPLPDSIWLEGPPNALSADGTP
jgi:cytochrome c peroxidase